MQGFLTRWERNDSGCDKSDMGLAGLSRPRALLLWLCCSLAFVDVTLPSEVLEQHLGFLCFAGVKFLLNAFVWVKC